MKALSRIGVALALVLGLMAVTTLSAAETTLKGTMKCGKCSLKKADKCQDVLSSPTTRARRPNTGWSRTKRPRRPATSARATAKATVTGEVSEKDGKKWITASKIEKTT